MAQTQMVWGMGCWRGEATTARFAKEILERQVQV